MKRYDLPLYVLFCLTRNTLSQKTSRSQKRSAVRIKQNKRKEKNVKKKNLKLNREKCSKKTHITGPHCLWIIDPAKLLHFKHFSLTYTLLEACGAVFFRHSKINLRKISLNEYFDAILHYFGVKNTLGLNDRQRTLLGLRFSWEPNAMQIPSDLLTLLSRGIIIRCLFYLWADLFLANVLRGVVFPPSHKPLLIRDQHSFPIVLSPW